MSRLRLPKLLRRLRKKATGAAGRNAARKIRTWASGCGATRATEKHPCGYGGAGGPGAQESLAKCIMTTLDTGFAGRPPKASLAQLARA